LKKWVGVFTQPRPIAATQISNFSAPAGSAQNG
jgi:hypothetical protein